MKALVIGATGAVGKDLVQQLIEDSSVATILLHFGAICSVSIPVPHAHSNTSSSADINSATSRQSFLLTLSL